MADFPWEAVDRSGDCWIWMGAREVCGYGRRGARRAHRWSWEVTNGPIPDGMRVCHTCDNPPCVNPAHLFLGTPADNSRDMVTKGRSNRGEVNGHSRFTPEVIREVRARRAAGATYRQIAEAFGTSKGTAHDLVNGRRWSHI